ncbi:MAG TPA: MucB/RseB C-terminal domain-containing protein [Nevskiaceae bacterium]|nr:MucB/RseB C-terminal domain-containing protein [Nevskiaceae bacterium]
MAVTRLPRLGLLLLACGTPLSVAAMTPAEWLIKASEAARASNYQGTVIYRGDDLLETFRVTHGYRDGQERERVHSLTGEVREVLKHNDKVVCILPKEQRLTVDRPTPKDLFPGLNPERIAQLSALYEIRDLGQARVAGRSCRGIAVIPRDRFRYGYEVWADERTAVPLKISLMGRDHRLLEQMFFTEVAFPAVIPDAAFESELDPAERRQATENAAPAISAVAESVAASKASVEQRRAPANAPLQMGQMPPGFRVTMRKVRSLPDGSGLVEHVLLTDGLTAISVFRTHQRVPVENAFRGVSQLGAVHAYGRVVGRTHITVVGEAPQETVRMIGDSLPEAELPVEPAATGAP